VVAGENVTRLLLTDHQIEAALFPPSLPTRRARPRNPPPAEAFSPPAAIHIAPVTLDAWDWMYAGVYEDAKKRGDAALQEPTGNQLPGFSDEVFAYSGKGIIQADHGIRAGSDSAAARQSTGSRSHRRAARGHAQARLPLLTLEERSAIPPTPLPDTYVSEEGAGWLDHWAITQGKPPPGGEKKPVFPSGSSDRSSS